MGRPRFSFKITILVMFAVLTLGLSTTMLYVNYARNSEATVLAADNLLEQVASKILGATEQMIEPLMALTETIALMPGIEVAIDANAKHPLAPILMAALERAPQMASAYFGNRVGDFFRIAALEGDREAARAVLKAPSDAMFAVQSIVADAERRRDARWRFLDAKQAEIGSRIDVNTAYDPRTRPWYIDARSAPGTIVTDYYAFASVPSVGLTVARHIDDGNLAGVFAVDLTLSSVSKYLAAVRASQLPGTKNAEIALFHLDGRLLAHSDKDSFEHVINAAASPRIPAVGEVGAGVLAPIVERFRGEGAARMHLADAKGADWLAHVAKLPAAFGEDAYLAVAVPREDFLGPLARTARQTLLISLVIVLAFLPLVYLMANAISAPLDRVTREIERIHNMDVVPGSPIRSAIAEIQDLADSLAQSKFMLRIFGKYVPRNLVQQFIETGTEPVLGGERRRLTVFFSDVRDFTTMSEELPPERLMLLTSEYLEGLVEVILANRGTVDKFVGDQIMAYWNAPTPNPDHVTDGCLTVLRCRDWSNARNAEWEREGQPILYTRFAVHAGDAVVGNVGSADRMDYTVVGNTINLGSRLEGLNKIYGTQVVISDSVADVVAGKFAMRPIDKVLPKGAVHPLRLFELLGAHPDWADAPADIVVDRATIDRCARWSEIYDLYLARHWTELLGALGDYAAANPGDSVAALYYERVNRFIMEPPTDDWDAIIRYSEK